MSKFGKRLNATLQGCVAELKERLESPPDTGTFQPLFPAASLGDSFATDEERRAAFARMTSTGTIWPKSSTGKRSAVKAQPGPIEPKAEPKPTRTSKKVKSPPKRSPSPAIRETIEVVDAPDRNPELIAGWVLEVKPVGGTAFTPLWFSLDSRRHVQKRAQETISIKPVAEAQIRHITPYTGKNTGWTLFLEFEGFPDDPEAIVGYHQFEKKTPRSRKWRKGTSSAGTYASILQQVIEFGYAADYYAIRVEVRDVYDRPEQPTTKRPPSIDQELVMRSVSEMLREYDVEELAELQSQWGGIGERVLDLLDHYDVIDTGAVVDDSHSHWRFTDAGLEWFKGWILDAIDPELRRVDLPDDVVIRLARSVTYWLEMRRLPRDWNLIPALTAYLRETYPDTLSPTATVSVRVSREVRKVIKAIKRVFEQKTAEELEEWIQAYLKGAFSETADEAATRFEFVDPVDSGDVLDTLRKQGLGDPPATPEPISLRELRNRKHDYIRMSDRWSRFLGKISPYYRVIFWGPPGGGKSTLALEFADELSKQRDKITKDRWQVLYAAVEEKPEAGGFRNRSRVARVNSPRVMILDTRTIDQIREQLKTGRYRAVVIDSVTDLTRDVQDVIDLSREFPELLWVFVVQALKDGSDMKGKSDLSFVVDGIVTVKNGIASTNPTKNRFNSPQTMNVFR